MTSSYKIIPMVLMLSSARNNRVRNRIKASPLLLKEQKKMKSRRLPSKLKILIRKKKPLLVVLILKRNQNTIKLIATIRILKIKFRKNLSL